MIRISHFVNYGDSDRVVQADYIINDELWGYTDAELMCVVQNAVRAVMNETMRLQLQLEGRSAEL